MTQSLSWKGTELERSPENKGTKPDLLPPAAACWGLSLNTVTPDSSRPRVFTEKWEVPSVLLKAPQGYLQEASDIRGRN